MTDRLTIEETAFLLQGISDGEWTAEQFAKAPASEKSKAIDSWKIRPIQHRVLGSIDKADAHLAAAAPRLARQLLATMQENERLKETLKRIGYMY